MNLGISFAPLVPSYVVWAGFVVALAISVLLLIARSRGAPFRAGVNIVMYAMTGNYKADQVHIPALLERLGQ